MQTQRTNKLIFRIVVTSVLFITACLVSTRADVGNTAAIDSAVDIDTSLVGIWDMTVTGSAVYKYKYSISVGTWVASGDIDQGFLNFHFGPTHGAYAKNADGSYRYREIGWTYSRGGVRTGSFESIGTFTVDGSGNQITGPGVFRLIDLKGNVVISENFTVVANRLTF
jgi:hypothetical protein